MTPGSNRLIAFLVGILSSLLILGIAEIFFRFNATQYWLPPIPNKPPQSSVEFDKARSELLYKELKSNKIFEWNHPLYLAPPSVLNEEIDVSQQVLQNCCIYQDLIRYGGTHYSRVITKKTQQIVYDVSYSYDSKGRRLTPQVIHPDNTLLIFGDSFTLGEGIDDTETTSYQLALLRPSTQIYNFGLSGGSPNQFLYETENDPSPRLEDISSDSVTILYVFMDNHLERLVGRSNAPRWINEQPYYVRNDDHLSLQGTFEERLPLNFMYWFIEKSALAKYFGLVLPPRFTDEHFDFLALTFRQSIENLGRRFKKITSYMVLYPGASKYYAKQVREAAARFNIAILDYSWVDMPFVTKNRVFLPIDGHPTPITHFILAHLLHKDLP